MGKDFWFSAGVGAVLTAAAIKFGTPSLWWDLIFWAGIVILAATTFNTASYAQHYRYRSACRESADATIRPYCVRWPI